MKSFLLRAGAVLICLAWYAPAQEPDLLGLDPFEGTEEAKPAVASSVSPQPPR